VAKVLDRARRRRGGSLQGGWWRGARVRHSPNHGPRPEGTRVDLVVVHSISLPPGRYGGPAIERLFANRLPAHAHPYFRQIHRLRVSAHFLIRRRGQVLQFVSCDQRAWHAGLSHWQGRDNCNDCSIGIELEGLEGHPFEDAQYRALSSLLRLLERHYPLRWAVGHQHVSPGRKGDPGQAFDWVRLRQGLGASSGLKLPQDVAFAE
jgi:N-acetyl-anhydromuramoyl-L-alanine amidase